MNIIIHRGENQIGGSIIEIATALTRILLDAGSELDESESRTLPDVEGLFDRKGFDGVFISHYHGDHIGLAYDIHPDIPIFLGEASTKIIQASDNYKQKKTIHPAGFLTHKKPIQIGDLVVTPFLCDHSAFDSYMLLVEGDGKRLLYTGDFRDNGRKSYNRLLHELPHEVDILICEGTMLSRANLLTLSERDLEEIAVRRIQETKGPVFVLQSSMNIDRIVTMCRAAKRTKRVFLEDLYMSEITSCIGGSIPNPISFEDVKTFTTRFYDAGHPRSNLLDKYQNRIGKIGISKANFIMCIRQSMLRYLQKLNELMSFEGGILFYSMWDGYKSDTAMAGFLEACKQMGLSIEKLHTSGHADENAIRSLIDTVNPKQILPIHTVNAEWFDGRAANT